MNTKNHTPEMGLDSLTAYARSLQSDREDCGGPPMSDQEAMARAALAYLPDSAPDSAWDAARAAIDAAK